MKGRKPLNREQLLNLFTQVREQTTNIATQKAVLDMVDRVRKEYPHEDAYINKHIYENVSSQVAKIFTPIEEFAKT